MVQALFEIRLDRRGSNPTIGRINMKRSERWRKICQVARLHIL